MQKLFLHAFALGTDLRAKGFLLGSLAMESTSPLEQLQQVVWPLIQVQRP